MKSCVKCLNVETTDTLQFAPTGVCNVCDSITHKQTNIDWAERKRELDEIVAEAKARNHRWDCIVPVSFGKDSSYQAWYVVTQLKLRPLLVRANHMGMRPGIERNKMRVLKKLGVECVDYFPSWNVVRETMRESLLRKGDSCWSCHTLTYSLPMHVAIERDIPLIFWGEALNTYQMWFNATDKESVDEVRFNRAMNLGMTATDMHSFLGGRVDMRDLAYHSYPEKSALDKLGARSICLGDYVYWDTDRQVDIIKRELGWEGDQVENVHPMWDFSKLECQYLGVREWLKWIKRGYGRNSDQANIMIRHGRMTREEGKAIADAYDGREPASLQFFLDQIGMERSEFYEIALSHVVDPWEPDLSSMQQGQPLPDMKDWV